MLRWIHIFLIFSAILPTSGRAEEISFSAAVDRETISLSDRLNYSLTIEGVRDGRPEIPQIPGFEIFASSTSTQFSLVNNRTRISQTVSYTLIPLAAGEFTIPPSRLVYGGQTYLTRPIRVNVVDGAVPPPPPPGRPSGPAAAPARPVEPTSEAPPPIFITTELDKERAYVNEQVTLRFKLYTRNIQVANLQYSPPPTTGFIEENLEEHRHQEAVRNRQRYEVLELPKAIFPVSDGDLTIGPAELKGDVLVPRRAQRSGPFGFDDFFGDSFFGGAFAERQPFVLRSPPISLTVIPLPREGRPSDFRGAVGNYEFSLAAAPSAVRVGEPITVTMRISGRGNLDSVALPEIPVGESFQTYAPEVETRKTIEGDRMGGEKIFKQVLIPLSEQSATIPPVSFSFFDPDRVEYRTSASPPIPIAVTAAPDREIPGLVEGARGRLGREGIRILGRDILHIQTDPGRLQLRGFPYYRRPLFLGAVFVFPGLLLAVWVATARRDRLKGDIVYARQVGASRSARKRFREARRLLAAGEGARFYGEVHQAFNRYLGDKFRLPAAAVSGVRIAEKLSAVSAPPELGAEVDNCLATFDRVRFSGSAARTEEMREFLSRVEELVGRLEKIRIK